MTLSLADLTRLTYHRPIGVVCLRTRRFQPKLTLLSTTHHTQLCNGIVIDDSTQQKQIPTYLPDSNTMNPSPSSTATPNEKDLVVISEGRKTPIMFLPIKHWSARYDNAYFTIKMDETKLFHDTPPPALPSCNGINVNIGNNRGGGTTATTASNTTNETTSNSIVIGGNSNHPAYYYKIVVFCSHSSRTIYRRYSQFKWLHQAITSSSSWSNNSNPVDVRQHHQQHRKPSQNQLHKSNKQQRSSPPQSLSFPPGTCFFQTQTDTFAQNRLEQLRDYMMDVLQTTQAQQYSQHPALIAFLQLDQV